VLSTYINCIIRQKKENFTIPRKSKTLNKSNGKSKKKSELLSMDLLELTKTSLENDKAQDIVVINLTGKTNFADFMVIASGSSRRQIAAMASHIKEKLKRAGLTEIPLEGADLNDWVLIDGRDVIVHLFRPEIRKFYSLEKMWAVEMPNPSEVA